MKDPELVDHTAWLPCDLLERFTVDVFRALGVPEDEARICADVLITADRRGIASHGVSRLKPIYYDRIVRDKIQHAETQITRKQPDIIVLRHVVVQLESKPATYGIVAKS